jgi:DnaJ domain
MNQNTAFKILRLQPGASLDQVKKAFRDLAKQYHPDRFLPDASLAGQDLPDVAETRLNRMKEINQAFHFLVPLLTPSDALTGKNLRGKAPRDKDSANMPPSSRPKPARDSRDKAPRDRAPRDKVSSPKPLSLQDILRMFKKRFVFCTKQGSRPNPCGQSRRKPDNPKKNRCVKPARFATILNTLHPAGTADKKNRGHGQGVKILSRDSRPPVRDSRRFVRDSEYQPYNRFLKYMALKKQIDTGRRPGREQNYNRIEKIHPVPRVNAIGNKDKS